MLFLSLMFQVSGLFSYAIVKVSRYQADRKYRKPEIKDKYYFNIRQRQVCFSSS